MKKYITKAYCNPTTYKYLFYLKDGLGNYMNIVHSFNIEINEEKLLVDGEIAFEYTTKTPVIVTFFIAPLNSDYVNNLISFCEKNNIFPKSPIISIKTPRIDVRNKPFFDKVYCPPTWSIIFFYIVIAILGAAIGYLLK